MALEPHVRFPVDLHTHSRASDGTDTPAELVARAHAAGLRVLALTDHDTIAGVEEAVRTGRHLGVEVVPGVEISLADEPAHDFVELHLLGLFIDPSHEALRDTLRRAIEARTEQKLAIVRNLQRMGFEITAEEVLAAAGGGVPGRMHIAQVFMAHNAGRVSGPQELFRDYISEGGRAYEPRRFKLGMEEAAGLIRAAGGVPVLAHPGAYEGERDIRRLLREARAQGAAGTEGRYPYDKNRPHFSMEQDALEDYIASIIALAREMDMLVTGGSDYHGERKAIALGEQGLTLEEYARLCVQCARAGDT